MSKILSSVPVGLPEAKIPGMHGNSRAALEKAAKEFESMFMNIVMKGMRDTIQESDAFGDPEKTKLFQSMLDTEYAAEMAKRGKIGLSDAIMRQLGPRVDAEIKKNEANKV